MTGQMQPIFENDSEPWPRINFMTPDEFAEEMRGLFGDGFDSEIAHTEADKVLCETLRALGYTEGVEIFKQAEKWYG